MHLMEQNVHALLDRVKRDVEDGLLPSCQIALGLEGEVVVNEVFGEADLDSRYCIYSATKAFVASTIWQLMAEGLIDVGKRVCEYLDEFDSEEMREVTVEQVMLHTSGFPRAPLGPPEWSTSASRRAKMATWHLNWEPGTRYEYHAGTAHWVLAEIINEVTGADYRDEVHTRVTESLGLPRILGINADDQAGILDVELTGENASPDDLEKVFGVREMRVTEVTDETLMRFNAPEVRELGVPGGGGFARASDLALFYQALLHDRGSLWDAEILADATGVVRQNLPAPDGVPAGRSLGLILAGEDGLSNKRGMGRTVSMAAFGHNGAGGQLAWADPTTGLSLGYTTNGRDRDEIRQPRRSTAIGSLAAVCVDA